MCITFFHLPRHPGRPYKLVLAMNRDEFTARPTSAARWRDGLVGGWDLQEGREGGTWLAMDTRGRLGLLTNIYTGGVLDQKAKGRGFLVVDWLKGNLSAMDYLTSLSQDPTTYNPFNLVLFETGDDGEYLVSRYSRGVPGHTENFGPVTERCGTFGVGNHPQHLPYRKTVWGRDRLEMVVDEEEGMVERLEELMMDQTQHWPDQQIVQQSSCSGTDGPFKQFGPQLSSVFVDIPVGRYQTRTTTFVTVNREDNVHFLEKNHIDDKTVTEFQFKC